MTSLFFEAWSATASNSDNKIGFAEHFSMASILPSVINPEYSLSARELSQDSNITFVEKRHVVNASKITLLKEQAISIGVKQPTCVVCVISLFWKQLFSASRSRVGIKSMPSFLLQAVNLRKKSIPPLPTNSLGNILIMSCAVIEEEVMKSLELDGLITSSRKGLHDSSKFPWKHPCHGEDCLS
ncbi:stemmadenine O-acetyltransferase-like [Rutidosis leptorrhynchoides]|uniref:stemmadenine O-acetyltransferase-like n=1 Tax=Rutidosis leptorrhynchoides TaxID=125765 RepID=UPI003A9987E9